MYCQTVVLMRALYFVLHCCPQERTKAHDLGIKLGKQAAELARLKAELDKQLVGGDTIGRVCMRRGGRACESTGGGGP